MGAKSKIAWTDATWNFLRGCEKVAEDCANCYAERYAVRFSGEGLHCEGLTADGHWTGEVRLVESHLDDPLRWTRPRRIFVNSQSDTFHKDVPDELLDRAFAIAALRQDHTFQILTKRPERALEWFKAKVGLETREETVARMAEHMGKIVWDSRGTNPWNYPSGTSAQYANRRVWPGWPLPNVWMGTTAGLQKTADARLPILLRIPAAVHWLSIEPFLGAISLDTNLGGTRWIGGQRGCDGMHRGVGTPECPAMPHHHHDDRCQPGLDWVVAGAESGPGARPMEEDWVRTVRDQCRENTVAFLYKQVVKNGQKEETPLLDGVRWVEFPNARKEDLHEVRRLSTDR